MVVEKYPFEERVEHGFDSRTSFFITKRFYELREEGLLEYRDHPSLPLRIWNYTRGCQYLAAWQPETLASRGLITDHEDRVITPAFVKFFNYGEPSCKLEEILDEITDQQTISHLNVDFDEKFDGSFGIVFHYNDKWYVASRGSFDSLWSLKGQDILSYYDASSLNPLCTYLVEIVFKGNRIVVDYGDINELCALGSLKRCEEGWIETDDYKSTPFKQPRSLKFDLGVEHELPLKEKIKRYTEELIKVYDKGDAQFEGFVGSIKIKGHVQRYRFKTKMPSYLDLHKNVMHIGEKNVWQICVGDIDEMKFLEFLPDEFEDWYKEKKTYYMHICAQKYAFYESMQAKMQVDLRVYWDRKHPDHHNKKSEWLAIWKAEGCTESEYGIFISWLGGKDVRRSILSPYKPKGVQTVGLSRIK